MGEWSVDVSAPRRPDEHLFGFIGSCDWDVEHGLGLLVEGFEVTEVGDQSIVR